MYLNGVKAIKVKLLKKVFRIFHHVPQDKKEFLVSDTKISVYL